MPTREGVIATTLGRPIGAIRAESWPDPEPGQASDVRGNGEPDAAMPSGARPADLLWAGNIHEKRWAYRSSTLQGLSFRFGIRCTDASLGRHIDAILAPLRSPVPAAHWYSLVVGSQGYVDVFQDGVLVRRVPDFHSCVAWLVWDINREVVESTRDHLLLHAGGVEAPNGGIAFPAPSGSGKSTLVVSLVRAGLNYLSDEVVALRLPDLRLIPYPRAMVVKSGSFAPLGEYESIGPPRLPPISDPSTTHTRNSVKQWYLRASELRPDSVSRGCELRLVVVPRYVPEAPTALRRLSDSEAFLALATSTVNIRDHGSSGVRALADIVERCDTYELVMSNLETARKLVLDLAEG